MVYFLHASDWVHALDAIYGGLIKVKLGAMMRTSLSRRILKPTKIKKSLTGIRNFLESSIQTL